MVALIFARLFGTQEVALLGGAFVAAAVSRAPGALAGGPHVAAHAPAVRPCG
jgi:hypothetical protein